MVVTKTGLPTMIVGCEAMETLLKQGLCVVKGDSYHGGYTKGEDYPQAQLLRVESTSSSSSRSDESVWAIVLFRQQVDGERSVYHVLQRVK